MLTLLERAKVSYCFIVSGSVSITRSQMALLSIKDCLEYVWKDARAVLKGVSAFVFASLLSWSDSGSEQSSWGHCLTWQHIPLRKYKFCSSQFGLFSQTPNILSWSTSLFTISCWWASRQANVKIKGDLCHAVMETLHIYCIHRI